MFLQNNIVLIGNSVTEQSKSIAHLKKRVICIDSFNDADLIGEKYKNNNQYGLVNSQTINILKNLKLKKEDTLIIVSSDYDQLEDYYEQLENFGNVIGNNLETILKIQNYKNLFSSLSENNIAYPEIYYSENDINDNAIIKNTFISGGLGVRKYNQDINFNNFQDNEFCQKLINGLPRSVVFISNQNKEFAIIGLNKIYNKRTKFTDYCFSGAESNHSISHSELNTLKKYINFFVKHYNLIGINGIDYINSDELYFLEVNPRITQTAFLYDNVFEDGFIDAHIQSCLTNILPIINSNMIKNHKFETLFAKSSFLFSYDLSSFDFLLNIPEKGVYIEEGQPICTIFASSGNEKKTNKLLLDNILLVKNKLKNIEIT